MRTPASTVLAPTLLLGLFLALLPGVGCRYHAAYAPAPLDPAWALAPAQSVPEGAVVVRFTGTSTLLFTDGETAWMVDGWFSRFEPLTLALSAVSPDQDAITYGLERNEVDELAAVFVLHSHFDHAMDAPEVARRTGATLIGSESTANLGRGNGLPESRIRVAKDGEPIQVGQFVITPIASKHFQFPNPKTREALLGGDHTIDEPMAPPNFAIQDYEVGQPFALHVAHGTDSFLIQGSAGYKDGSLSKFDTDTVFLGVGGLGGQTAAYREAYWQETVEETNARRVIAIHWDSLFAPLDRPLSGEMKLLEGPLAGGATELRAFLESKAKEPDAMPIYTLPRFAPVVLFP